MNWIFVSVSVGIHQHVSKNLFSSHPWSFLDLLQKIQQVFCPSIVIRHKKKLKFHSSNGQISGYNDM